MQDIGLPRPTQQQLAVEPLGTGEIARLLQPQRLRQLRRRGAGAASW
ncbi:MAG: hypothetical protein QNJ30_18335 [Kiloniellales bacterium]|nr:hypothetical protein [Kiloniellales bacterium]